MKTYMYSRLREKKLTLGFTVAELAAVIVIIGILAGLVVVSFGSWQKSIAEKEVKSELTSLGATMNSARNFNNGYPGYLPSSYTPSKGVMVSYGNGDTQTFCLDGVSKATPSVSLFVTQDGVLKKGSCAGGEIADYSPPGSFAIANMEVATGATCAITIDRKAYCWGAGGNGKLGNGSTANQSRPVLVAPSGAMSGKLVSQIGLSNQHGCALAEGKVYCWGSNMYRVYSNGSTSGSSNIPVEVFLSGLHTTVAGNIDTVTVGNMRTCVMKQGQPYCSGYNQFGDLGNGDMTIQANSVKLSSSSFLVGTSIEYIPDDDQNVTCAINDGQLACWGQNSDGQVGDGTTTNSSVPKAITGGALSGKYVTHVANGNTLTCAVANGSAYCWGRNTYGALGDGTTTTRTLPVAVSTAGVLAGKKVSKVGIGADFACALAEGRVYCWGANYGKLGDGSGSTQSLTPVAVSISGLLAGKTVTDMEVGSDHTCVLATADMYCWGYNSDGQLGNNTTATSTTPSKVVAPL